MLAIFVLLSSLLAWSAIAAKPVLAAVGADPTTTTITSSAPSFTAGGSSTITVQLNDFNGDPVPPAGADTVTLATTLGSITGLADNGDSTWTATLSSTDAGTAVVSGQVNDQDIDDTESVTIDPAAPSAADSTVVAASNSISADTGSVGITVTVKDQYGNLRLGDTVVVSSNHGNVGSTTNNNDGTYSATLTDTTAHTDTVSATANSVSITDTDTVVITPGATSAAHTTIDAAPPTINTDIGTSTVTVTAKDQYDNLRGTGGDTVAVSTTHGSFSPATPDSNGDGTYTTTLTDTLTGTDTVTGTINGNTIGDNATVDFTPGALSYFTFDSVGSQVAGTAFNVTVRAYDAHDNLKTDYTGTQAATLSGLAASPGCAGCSPMLGAASADYGTLTWDHGVGTATGVKAFKADGASKLTITDGSVSETSNDFAVDNAATLAGFDLLPITAKVAGTAFTANVTAYDAYGNVLDTYSNVAAHLTGLLASPGCSGCSPVIPSTNADHGTLSWSGGSATASVKALKAAASTLTVTDGSISNSSNFSVDDNATLGGFDLLPISGQTAGDGFGITATAYDTYGNVFDTFAGAGTSLSGLNASPGCSVCGSTLASVPADYGTLSWSDGVGTSTVKAYKAEAATLTIGNGPGVGTFSNSSSFTVDHKHTLGGLSIADITSPKVAGTAFGVSVTAYDPYGNIKKDHASVTLSGLADSPGCAAPDCTPAITAAPATYVATTGWVDGVYGADVTAKRSQTLASVTATDGASSDTSTTFTVNAASPSKLLFSDATLGFNGRPIDTKLSQPIYSVCTPPGAGANPCGVPPASVGTKVLAIDAFGNRASATVTITKTAGAGTLANGGATATGGTTQGVAPFGEATFNTMNVNALGSVTLTAAASGATSASTGIRIVSDLEACDGTSCDNLATNSLIHSFGKIVTTSDFFNTGLQTNVILNTALVPASDFANKCGPSATVFGNGSDVRATGAGVTSTAPASTMVIVVPKKVLQDLHIQSRSANHFDVCLGALWIDGAHTPSPWKTKDGSLAVVRDPGTDPLRYWGTPADCGAKNLPATSPCIALRTKQVSDVANYLHTTTAAVSAYMSNSDIAIIVKKPFPWDGKGGLY